VNPKEGTAEDSNPMAFMLGAVKGKIANLTQDNKEEEGDKKNESAVKEDYPEDFN